MLQFGQILFHTDTAVCNRAKGLIGGSKATLHGGYLLRDRFDFRIQRLDAGVDLISTTGNLRGTIREGAVLCGELSGSGTELVDPGNQGWYLAVQ